MSLGLMALKVGMTQVYHDLDEGKGKIAAVTVLQVGPCPILQVRSQERDGYDALQLGFLNKARRKAIRILSCSRSNHASQRSWCVPCKCSSVASARPRKKVR